MRKINKWATFWMERDGIGRRVTDLMMKGMELQGNISLHPMQFVLGTWIIIHSLVWFPISPDSLLSATPFWRIWPQGTIVICPLGKTLDEDHGKIEILCVRSRIKVSGHLLWTKMSFFLFPRTKKRTWFFLLHLYRLSHLVIFSVSSSFFSKWPSVSSFYWEKTKKKAIIIMILHLSPFYSLTYSPSLHFIRYI